MSTSPEQPAAGPLSYARSDGALLVCAYRLVGWFYLGLGILALPEWVGIFEDQGVSMVRSAGVWYPLSRLLPCAAIFGAIPMIRGRCWGAMFVAGMYALTVVSMFVVASPLVAQTRNWIANPMLLRFTLGDAPHIFLPLSMWLLCRKHGLLQR